MGIKGLWSVLTPFSEKKSLHEVRGQVLAVDLAGWVCDSQNVTEYHIQPKLYLRNLFFRTIYLLLADVEPIFVMDGDAPELKRNVMASRNAIQFKGAAPRAETAAKKQPDVRRKRFSNVLRECESLLKSMGVRCIKGKGEAEATCAQLNSEGLVDAVVSQDSDCFAYGARRVYRNFSVSSAAGAGAMQGSIDCYDAEKMFQSNGFGRNKMVALALLCGCDYGLGACGSSITTVLSFIQTIPDKDIIPRLVSWVSDPEHYEERTRWAAAPGRCDRCGHVGRTHAKNGCPVCATHKGCDDKGHKSKVAAVKRELALRTRALSCGMPFPEPKVMKEFMEATTEKLDLNSLKKPSPSLIQFVKLMSGKLDWSEKYCVQKFLPLLTKWHLQDNVPHKTIQPTKIKKKRNPKGVPSYEVQWTDIDGQYEALISDNQFEEGEDRTAPWTTTERQDLLRRYYPDVVEAYEESIRKPVKEKKSGRRRKNDSQAIEKPKRKYNKKAKKLNEEEIDNLSRSIRNCDLANKTLGLNSSKPSAKVVKLKRKLKSGHSSKKQKTLTSFIANKKRKSSKELHSLHESFKNMSLNNSNNVNMLNDLEDEKVLSKKSNSLLDMFQSADESVDGSDLSDIVDNIVSKAPGVKTARLNRNLVKLVFNKHTPRKSVFRKKGEDRTAPWTTTERQELLRRYYPDVVEAYKESIQKPVKDKKSGRRGKNDSQAIENPQRKYNKKAKKLNEELIDNLSRSIRNCDLVNKTLGLNSSKPSAKVVKLKRKLKSGPSSKKQKTLTSFIANKKRKYSKELSSLHDSFKNMSLNSRNNENMLIDLEDEKAFAKKSNSLLDMFQSADESVDGSDLSDIVDNIVSKAPGVKTARLNRNLVKLVFNKHTPRKSVFRKSALIDLHYNCSTPERSLNKENSSSHANNNKMNTSYFFDKLSEQRDAFELSVDNLDYKLSVTAVYEDCDFNEKYNRPL